MWAQHLFPFSFFSFFSFLSSLFLFLLPSSFFFRSPKLWRTTQELGAGVRRGRRGGGKRGNGSGSAGGFHRGCVAVGGNCGDGGQRGVVAAATRSHGGRSSAVDSHGRGA